MFSGRDVRYVIFYADRHNSSFTITHVVVVTGADFFQEHRQFGGLTTNKKIVSYVCLLPGSLARKASMGQSYPYYPVHFVLKIP